MIVFRKARNPQQTLNDLDEYLRTVGDKPVRWLAREVQSWGEFSYDEIAALIENGQLDALIDWQERWAGVVNGTLAPMWAKAIEEASRKATKGMTVLSDSNDYVKAWVSSHGGELITLLSDESRKAISNILLRGQGLRMAPRDIAKDIRPLIGLTDRQAQANLKYKNVVYQKLLDNGMSEAKARERSEAAALRYAGKQHRYRAESIVLTENAFAYNRGAHMGVSQSIADGYMGRCEMVWTTAGTNRVCGRCMELKDTVVGTTDQSGVTIPPLHPRCRCAIMYREVGVPRVMQPKPSLGVQSPPSSSSNSTPPEVPNTQPTSGRDFKTGVESLRKTLQTQRTHGATVAEMEATIKAAGRLVVKEIKAINVYDLPLEDKIFIEDLRDTYNDFAEWLVAVYGKKPPQEYKELHKIYNLIGFELAEFEIEYMNQQFEIFKNRAEQLKSILLKVRPMGATPEQLKMQFDKPSLVRSTLEQALNCFPSDWVSESVKHGFLTPQKTPKDTRGFYTGQKILIEGKYYFDSAVHEFGHRMEAVVKGLLEAEAEFYSRRTAGEKLEKLRDLTGSNDYEESEVTRKDKFLDVYVGKDYNGYYYELVSMGFQWAYTNPLLLLQDMDMAEWIFGLLTIF